MGFRSNLLLITLAALVTSTSRFSATLFSTEPHEACSIGAQTLPVDRGVPYSVAAAQNGRLRLTDPAPPQTDVDTIDSTIAVIEEKSGATDDAPPDVPPDDTVIIAVDGTLYMESDMHTVRYPFSTYFSENLSFTLDIGYGAMRAIFPRWALVGVSRQDG